MGQSENDGITYAVELTKKCISEFKKDCKRMNPNLRKEIDENLEKLKTNPDLGEELSQDLAGMRSIHLNKYDYRILYDKHDNPSNKVVVLKIGYRKDFYTDYSRYREFQVSG